VAARLNGEIKKILAMPDIAKRITDLGGEVRTDTPDQFAGWITKAIADWGAVVKAEGISTDG
jgi:tripartite-type tricarboxylate transporter receptor subunit TctC